jgi:putative hemolysin
VRSSAEKKFAFRKGVYMKFLLIIAVVLGAHNVFAADAIFNDACVGFGGKVIEDQPSNLHSLCKIDDAYLGLAALYYRTRATDPVFTQAVTLYCSRNSVALPPVVNSGSPFTPSQASEYCTSVGGKVVFVNALYIHENLGVCHLGDGSNIEQWTLYRGNSNPENANMTKLLQCGR